MIILPAEKMSSVDAAENLIVTGAEESYIMYDRIPSVPSVFPDVKPKPTCSKHHEYVERRTQENNVIYSVWACRHCGRKL